MTELLKLIISLMGFLLLAVIIIPLFTKDVSEKHSEINSKVINFALAVTIISIVGWVLISAVVGSNPCLFGGTCE